MKIIEKNSIKTKKDLQFGINNSYLVEKIFDVIQNGKTAFDECLYALGKEFAETLMFMERETIAGPMYYPNNAEIKKGGRQKGSIYIGDQKLPIEYYRVHDSHGEIHLKTYKQLKDKNAFSNEILEKVLRGISGRKYSETLLNVGKTFGIKKSTVSNRIIEASSARLKKFRERDLSDFNLLAMFLDGIHRGGKAFVVALGLDTGGHKKVLGFWEGATENAVICSDLLSELESRGLVIENSTLFITDGGKGIIKALKDRFGKFLIHQRCTNHKLVNIQKKLPRRYRKKAKFEFRRALEMNTYEDAKKELMKFRNWIASINESAAFSLDEAFEELLTLHKLKIPLLFRKTLHTTNPIESPFSQVRKTEHNIKHYKNSAMAQRWLGTVLLYAEQNFRTVKGYAFIQNLIDEIKQYHFKLKKVA